MHMLMTDTRKNCGSARASASYLVLGMHMLRQRAETDNPAATVRGCSHLMRFPGFRREVRWDRSWTEVGMLPCYACAGSFGCAPRARVCLCCVVGAGGMLVAAGSSQQYSMQLLRASCWERPGSLTLFGGLVPTGL